MESKIKREPNRNPKDQKLNPKNPNLTRHNFLTSKIVRENPSHLPALYPPSRVPSPQPPEQNRGQVSARRGLIVLRFLILRTSPLHIPSQSTPSPTPRVDVQSSGVRQKRFECITLSNPSHFPTPYPPLPSVPPPLPSEQRYRGVRKRSSSVLRLLSL